MIAYDFDQTIFDADSSIGFYKYCLSKRPLLVIYHAILAIPYIVMYLLKIKTRNQTIDKIFSFVPKLNNIIELVEDYWDLNEGKIKTWYKEVYDPNDVIISATYDFILKPICARLNIKNLICTDYHIGKGKTVGMYCYKGNKIKLFEKRFKNQNITKAYSDSPSDIPLLEYAKEGYVVIKNKIIPYEKNIFKKIRRKLV